MNNVIGRLGIASIFALVLASPGNAQPCYHSLWGLTEVYTNADGSVQFLLMQSAIVNGVGGRLAGQTLVVSDGVTEHSLAFATELPDPSKPSVLIGTQRFADLGLVKPDFIVPEGFVFLSNGSIRLRDSSWYCARDVHYAALPTDGLNALYPDTWGDGETYIASAYVVNNAGQTYVFTPNFGGLWWKAPAGAESGWGLALEQQGGYVLTAWATYDIDRSPVWFVSIAGRLTPGVDDGNFQGPIHRMAGPAFDAMPFDPAAVRAHQVGWAQLSFADGDHGNFLYSIGAASANKSITRQRFAEPLPVCALVASPGSVANYQGMWWNASESGWGLHLTHQGGVIFAVWFTYDTTGKATWLSMTAVRTATETYAGAIVRTTGPPFSAATFEPSAVTSAEVGTGTLTFSDRSNGAFAYTIGAVAQTKQIARQIFAGPTAICN